MLFGTSADASDPLQLEVVGVAWIVQLVKFACDGLVHDKSVIALFDCTAIGLACKTSEVVEVTVTVTFAVIGALLVPMHVIVNVVV